MNTPRMNPEINPDDPKWTAYVLGELDDAERARIERLIETSDEARALVDELNLAALTLKDELAPLGSLALTPEQRAAIQGAIAPEPRRWFGVAPMKWGLGLATAAAVVLAAWVGLAPSPPQRVAQVLPEEQNLGTAIEDLRSEPRPSNNMEPKAAASPTSASRQEESNPKAENERKLAKATGQTPSDDRAAENQGKAQPGVGKDVADLVRVLQREEVARVPAENVNTVSDEPAGKDERGQTAAAPPAPAPPPQVLGAIRTVPPSVAAPAAPAGGGRGGRGGGGAARGGGAVPNAQAGAPAAGPGQGGGATGDAPRGGAAQNEPDLLRYLSQVAGGTGGAVRVDGFQGPLAATPPPPPPPPGAALNRFNAPGPNTEAYDRIVDNPFIRTSQENFVHVLHRRRHGLVCQRAALPDAEPAAAEGRSAHRGDDQLLHLRLRRRRRGNDPIRRHMEVAAARGIREHRLVRIGIKAREINANRRPPSNLVFLHRRVRLDERAGTSCRWSRPRLEMLVEQLGESDTGSRSSSMPAPQGWCCRRRSGDPQGRDQRGHRQPATPAARRTAPRASSSPTTGGPRTSSAAASIASSWRPTAISTSA